MTDAEIIAVLEKSAGKVCGRLKTMDLDRPIVNTEPAIRKSTIRQAIAAMLVILSSKQVMAHQPKVKAPTFVNPMAENSVEIYPDYADTSHTSELTGTVLDSITNSPIEFATVQNLKTQKGVLTDSLGRFKITASSGDTIVINALSYAVKKVVLNNLNNRTILMDERMEMLTLGGMIMYRKPTLKEKIKRFFLGKYRPHYYGKRKL